MVKRNAHFDGKVIVPDEPTGLAPGTRLRVTLEAVDHVVSPAAGKMELPLLTGVDPQIVLAIMEGPEFEAGSAKLERFLDPTVPENPR